MRGTLRPVQGRLGYWELAVEAGRDPVTGRRRRVVRGFRGGRRAAEQALNDLVAEVSSGRASASSATVAFLMDRWLENVEDTMSPRTLGGYRRISAQRIVPALGKIKLNKLTAAHLDRVYRSLSAGGLAPASVRMVHAVMSSALGQAVRWGWIGSNVADRATPPPVRQARAAPPEPEDVIRLIEAAKRSRYPDLGVFFHLAAITGARRGELIALRWSDVDLVGAQVLIDTAVIQLGRVVIEKDTKTHQARRVAIDAATVDLLAAHKTAMEQRAELCGLILGEGAFVFSDEPAALAPWKPDRVTLAFGRFCKQERVTGVRLHDLRHFAATRLLSSGIDVRTVSGRLGHANASTTLGVYAHFLQSADQAAAAVLGGILEEARRTPRESHGGSQPTNAASS
jgi:integrase